MKETNTSEYTFYKIIMTINDRTIETDLINEDDDPFEIFSALVDALGKGHVQMIQTTSKNTHTEMDVSSQVQL